MEWFFLWLVCGAGAAVIASSKGRSALGWFLGGILLGPISLLIAGFMPPLPKVEASSTEVGGEVSMRRHRACPYCAEDILVEARLCKHCKSEVAPLMGEEHMNCDASQDIENGGMVCSKHECERTEGGEPLVTEEKTRKQLSALRYVIPLLVILCVVVVAMLQAKKDIVVNNVTTRQHADIINNLSPDFLGQMRLYIQRSHGVCENITQLAYSEEKFGYVAYCTNGGEKSVYKIVFRADVK